MLGPVNHFEGIFPIVNTTFDAAGRLDLDSQLRLVRFLLDCGAHGLGLFGTASEGYTLNGEERLTLLRLIVREVHGRVPIVVSTGHTGTDVAVALSRQAQEEGAQAVMVVPPYYLKPDAEGIFEYYRAIDAALEIPIMVQDAPLMTAVAMAPALLARLGRELPRVRYAKIEAPPTGPKMTDVRRLAGDELTIFGGLNGQFLIEELNRGASGTMPGSDLTDMFVHVHHAWKTGDEAAARAEFTRYLPIIRYELQPGLGVSAMKHNLAAGGVIASARVRHPTRTLDDIGLRELAVLREGVQMRALTWAASGVIR
ncbi:MAG: dihydrodipicolinate synthase family protein [Luteitalea sp.]|nr:dihydrodipicolinate synthase family protein [Luteitalea sp.]